MSNRRRATADAPGGSMSDVLEGLKQEGHLTSRQYEAGVLLLALLQASHGNSAGLIGELLDKVDGKAYQPSAPIGGSGSGIRELDHLLKGLRQHEREFFKAMVKLRESSRGALEGWAGTKSSYKTNKTRRSFAVGRATAFLDGVAELIFGQVPTLEEQMEDRLLRGP